MIRMRKLVPYITLVLMIVSILLPIGIGYAQPPNLTVALGELNFWDDWSINPCKYEYKWAYCDTVATTISNLSSKDCSFDLGDGNMVMIPGKGNLTHYYQVPLKGQTERIRITKLTEVQTGMAMQEALVLKIEPRTKGGD